MSKSVRRIRTDDLICTKNHLKENHLLKVSKNTSISYQKPNLNAYTLYDYIVETLKVNKRLYNVR